MKRVGKVLILSLVVLLIVSGTALAAWPSGSSGDQYSAVNAAMQSAVAGAGISPDTFTNIYNDAAAGNTSGFSSSQVAAACKVLSSLSSYQSVLSDYTTVYNNLGCGSISSSNTNSSSLPSTGITMGLLIGSGLIGLGAASMLLRKSRSRHQQ